MSPLSKIVVEQHQGKISCVSALGEGTQLIVEIPLRSVEISTLECGVSSQNLPI